jgi:hypothetical protein
MEEDGEAGKRILNRVRALRCLSLEDKNNQKKSLLSFCGSLLLSFCSVVAEMECDLRIN